MRESFLQTVWRIRVPFVFFITWSFFLVGTCLFFHDNLVLGILFVLNAAASIAWQYWFGLAFLLWCILLFRERKLFLRAAASESVISKKAVQVTAGWSFWYSTSWVFDNLAYPAVIAWLGLLTGGLIMTAVALSINIAFLLVYEHNKTDWLGMGAVDSLKESIPAWIGKLDRKRFHNLFMLWTVKAIVFIPKMILRLGLWMISKGNAFAFFALSIFVGDPFVTLAYLRRGAFNGLRIKDWTIFFASGIVSNVYWSLRSFGLVFILQYFYRYI